ncbi:MAG: methyltransferase domain-containing protein [Ornithinimicrobium sp.]
MQTDDLAERLFDSMLGTFDVLSIYLGEQLGLYAVLHGGTPVTTLQLADKAGIDPRYAREWLEQQTVSGLLEVDDPTQSADERRYHLPAEHAEVLTNTDSLAYLTPFARVMASAAVQLPALLEAYRTGDGVPWAQYGDAMRTGQGDANKALFLQLLGSQWLPTIPGLDAALRAGGRIADVGCGEGWSSIAMALAYPEVSVEGIDLDHESTETARRHAEHYGVGDRVSFRTAEAGGSPGEEDAYTLVTAFECVHDMAGPVQVLAAMRTMAAPDGHVVVMDERVGETFTGSGDPVERLMYGMSLFICLPDGMSHSPSAGTGTVMRPATLRGYAEQAGFAGVDVLPIDNDLFRFYSLTQ